MDRQFESNKANFHVFDITQKLGLTLRLIINSVSNEDNRRMIDKVVKYVENKEIS